VSITVITILLLLFCLSTRFKYIEPTLFFTLLIVGTLIAAAGASYLQNAVVALSALFGPSYLQGILSGQGAIGAAVSIAQFLSALSGVQSVNTLVNTDDPFDKEQDNLRSSAFVFFLIATVFSFTAFLAHLGLVKMPFYRLTVRGAETSSDAGSDDREQVSSRTIERKVRVLGCAVFFIFFITLSVFPVSHQLALSFQYKVTRYTVNY